MLKMKKRKISKKGISPMIATILLIGFVIAIILLIILWGKNYIEELAEKRGLLAEKQQECTKIDIVAVKKAICKGKHIEVVLRNKKDLTINKLIFRINGRSWSETFESTDRLGSLETKLYEGDFPENAKEGISCDTIASLDVIPHLKVALGHYVPCSKQKISVLIEKNI